MWWVYVLRCRDGSFYTGATNHLRRRVEAHQAGQGARYTRSRRPVRLWWVSGPYGHSQALRLEFRIKRLSHSEKMALPGRTASEGGMG